MAVKLFVVDGVDFTDCIKACTGLKYKKTDLDSENAGRTMDTVMHRDKLGEKRTLTVSCLSRLPDTRARKLALALNKVYVSVTYPDLLLGTVTRTFYGTEIEGTVWGVYNGKLCWSDISFTLTEV